MNNLDDALALLQKADETYYHTGEIILDDSTYDAIERYILLSPECTPTIKNIINNRVGYNLSRIKDERKKKHLFKMKGVNKVYSIGDVVDWCRKNWVKGRKYSVTPKYDGIAISLTYSEDGNLISALTRGDGDYGIDILNKITSNPLGIGYAFILTKVTPKKQGLGLINICGELVISKIGQAKYLESTNEENVNFRNKVAGVANSKDKDFNLSGLTFIPYSIRCSNGVPIDFNILKESFFGRNEVNMDERIIDISLMQQTLTEMLSDSYRGEFPFDIDGLVIKSDNIDELPNNSPKHQGVLAIKFQPKSEATYLLDVILQKGEKGKLTPVAIIEPVYIGGSKIERVNLYNLDYVRNMDLYLEDLVEVAKQGDVIPKIVNVVKGLRKENAISVWKYLQSKDD